MRAGEVVNKIIEIDVITVKNDKYTNNPLTIRKSLVNILLFQRVSRIIPKNKSAKLVISS